MRNVLSFSPNPSHNTRAIGPTVLVDRPESESADGYQAHGSHLLSWGCRHSCFRQRDGRTVAPRIDVDETARRQRCLIDLRQDCGELGDNLLIVVPVVVGLESTAVAVSQIVYLTISDHHWLEDAAARLQPLVHPTP